jgi:lipopolysaccharide heptosyltransferase I
MPGDLARSDFRNILILKPSAIGDVVHALPVLAGLRRRFPAARIAWLVNPGCADVLDGHPALDEVILFERERFGRMTRSADAALGFARLLGELRRRRFDLALDLQGLFRSGFLAAASGARVRVGLSDAREFAGVFHTHRIDAGPPDAHAVDRLWRVAAALGCPGGPTDFAVAPSPQARAGADRLLAEAGIPPGAPFAVLVVGAMWATKLWSAEGFAAVARGLAARRGLPSVILGGAGDSVRAERVAALCDGAAANLAGRTGLREAVAVLARATVVITNDTGPMHIAAALDRPLVGVFGPTSPERTGPFRRPASVVRAAGVACSPCYRRRCPTQMECMSGVTAEQVLSAAERELEAASG